MVQIKKTGTISIGKADVVWSYSATFLQIAVHALLLPFILRFLPQETIGVWTIFTSFMALVGLLDFGFNPTFTRNVTYIYSGVKSLKATGFQTVEGNTEIDYDLLKGLINVMRSFYSWVAVLLLLILVTLGTYYIHVILRTYTGNKNEILTAWFILCLANSYLLFTMYYDALLLGTGLIKRSRQINIVGQSLYLVLSIALILSGFGLIAIVSAQVVSVIARRILAYRAVYTKELKRKLVNAEAKEKKEIFKAVYPNAVKMGLTGLGAVLVLHSQVIIGSLYLPLVIIASYGITMQLINVLSAVGTVYYSTYLPKITQYRIENNKIAVKQLYIKSCFILIVVFIVGGSGLLLFGDWALNAIGSKTPLLANIFIFVALLIALLANNHGIAGGILLTKNYVPFFKPTLFAGLLTIILLFLFLAYFEMDIWALILSGGLAHAVYNNWKWPLEVLRELKEQ